MLSWTHSSKSKTPDYTHKIHLPHILPIPPPSTPLQVKRRNTPTPTPCVAQHVSATHQADMLVVRTVMEMDAA